MTSRPAHIVMPRRRPRIRAVSTPSTARRRSSTFPDRGRRVFDVVAALLLLLTFLPLLVAISLVIAITSPGSPLFRQVRVGRGERPFTIYKFRTMYAGCDDRPHREYIRRVLLGAPPPPGPHGLCKLVDDPRVTRVGRLLRRCSVDELPQLLNVLRGDMSLVGPRPVLPWEAALFESRHRPRFDVRPGITGLWQVSGRSRLSLSEALDLDLQYVRTRCLRLDLMILLRTVPTVLTCRGAA